METYTQNDIELEKYMKSLDDKERIAIQIAKEHLESSFDIMKCNGFHDFKRKQKNKT